MNFRNDAKVLKALADEKRLSIMDVLKNGEICACLLMNKLGINQSTLSHHMKILCDSGIVDYRKEGTWVHYSISEEGVKNLEQIVSNYTTIVGGGELEAGVH